MPSPSDKPPSAAKGSQHGALDCSADGIVDSGRDNKGEEACVGVSPTSREAIKDVCAWRCSQSFKTAEFSVTTCEIFHMYA